MQTNQKYLEESIIATIKAIAKITKIEVNFDDQKIDFVDINQNLARNISLPKISNHNDLLTTRGFADLVALYLKFHNSNIHQITLENQQFQKLFDDFEKFRIIKLGIEEFKGVVVNLEPILIQNLDQISGHYFLPFLMFANQPVFSCHLIDKLKPYQTLISKDLSTKITQLANLINDQKSFSLKTLELIELLNHQSKESAQKETKPPENHTPENAKEPNPTNNAENIEQEIKVNQSMAQDKENKITKIFEQGEQAFSIPTKIEDLNPPNANIKFVPEYKIFSRKFDQIIKAGDLADAKDLANLRFHLDLKLAKLQKTSKRLTTKLKRELLAKKQISYQFNKEDGSLDRRKITQIIANPFSGNNYSTIKEDDYQNTILSILLDNSGSMRGTPIVMSAMATEIIAKIFEGFGIKTEILGFTTSDWRGGNARKLWEKSGKPKNPGRLSDLRHIIYKNANQSFKKSKNNLALMLKDGILKENIDGEALIWAGTRLKSRNEKRKILLVISDGTPVDDSTNSNNDNDILNDHLHQTIHRLEKHSKIEIAAIGILHNVGDFYRNSITIQNIEELGDVMIERICRIITK